MEQGGDEDVLEMPGVEWDEMEGKVICVFVPVAARARLATFLRTRCGEDRSFIMLDPEDARASSSRWTPEDIEEGAFFFDDNDRLVIPAPPKTAVRLAQELEAGDSELEFGDVRITVIGN